MRQAPFSSTFDFRTSCHLLWPAWARASLILSGLPAMSNSMSTENPPKDTLPFVKIEYFGGRNGPYRVKLVYWREIIPACSSISPTTDPIAAAWDLHSFKSVEFSWLVGWCSNRTITEHNSGWPQKCHTWPKSYSTTPLRITNNQRWPPKHILDSKLTLVTQGNHMMDSWLRDVILGVDIPRDLTCPYPPPQACPKIQTAAQSKFTWVECKLFPPIKIFPQDGRS